MIHPTIALVFPDNDKSVLLVSQICKNVRKVDDLLEFIKWHLEVNKDVIREIGDTQSVDFSKEVDARIWANEFLLNYEKKIRGMRHVSNLVFDRFYKLKNYEFTNITFENKDYEKELIKFMHTFLNEKELLIGKIIFAYRETWFLANQIYDPNFKLGSVKKYKEWVNDNFMNLKELDKSLEIIHNEISKWKR